MNAEGKGTRTGHEVERREREEGEGRKMWSGREEKGKKKGR